MRRRNRQQIDYKFEKRRHGGGGAFVFLIIIVVSGLIGAILHTQHIRHTKALSPQPLQTQTARHVVVEMYSLSRCGNCMITARNMREAGIPFTEYMVDRDEAKNREMWRRMDALNFKGNSTGAPVIFVNGKMLMGRQSASNIRAAMR